MNRLFAFGILCISTIELYSQCIEQNGDLSSPPCNEVISTNPANPTNNERPVMTNYFDWKAQNLQVYHPAGGYVGAVSPMLNPFHTDFEYLSNLNYFKIDYASRTPDKLDFFSEDGWELIKKGNGYAMDEITQLANSENRIGPYFILYNKYKSQLRVLASFSNIGLNQAMYTNLQIKKPNSSDAFYSALLSKYTKSIEPLNQPINVVISSQGFQGAPVRGWFGSDFSVNYDPCICNYRSSLLVQFGTKNVGDITLEGRLIGTSTPLDNSGQPPLQNGRDFLTSVFAKPNFSVKGGMLTYSNIDKLVDLYYSPSTALPIIGVDGRDALKDLLKSAGEAGNRAVGESSFSGLSSFLRVGPELTALGTSVSGLLKALGPIGAATSFLSAQLFPSKPSPTVSVMEAELALTGSVKFDTPIVDGDIEFATPGSKFTNNPTQVPDSKYPLYNEALGTFAVFEKPKVRLYSNVRAYEANSLKYYFNPAVPINLANTKILAALVYNYPTVPKTYPLPAPNNMKSTGNTNEFSTDFVPIESLHRIYAGAGNIVVPVVSLRLQIFYEFLPNANGKVIRNWEVLTYPTDISYNTIWAGDDYDRTFNTWNYTEIGTYTVLRDIAVNGTQSTALGVSTIFKSGNSITVNANSVLKPGITLQTVPITALYNDQPTSPVSALYVKSFCSTNSSQYKAKNLSPAARFAEEEQRKQEEDAKNSQEETTAFPNPTTGKVSFRYYIDEPTQVRLDLISTTGTVVATPVDAFQEAGPFEFAYDASNLPAGIYLYRLETSKGKETKRLVIIK